MRAKTTPKTAGLLSSEPESPDDVWLCASQGMTNRRADVFFYGLFMDQELLRGKGLTPQGIELAWVDGFSLRIGQRAALVPKLGGRVHGVVISLMLEELDRLYSEPSVSAYE